MIGPITQGEAKDSFHEEILGAINFKDSKAYEDSVARLAAMGFSEQEISTLLENSNGK